MALSQSFVVAPYWQIVPDGATMVGDARAIKLATGPGFGDGRHPTTQVCLQALGALAPSGRAWSMLDFGSGSGVLSIAGALLGARVDAVEIDVDAIAHATTNLAANEVGASVTQHRALDDARGPYDLVVANILRGVIVAFADALVSRTAPRGALVLSGLVSTDAPDVIARFAPLLSGARPEVYERGEWRALVWRSLAR